VLRQAQPTRQAFLKGQPEVTRRLAEFDREMEHCQELERQRSWARPVERERNRHRGMSHGIDTGLGIDL
jgi:hypothetical protein